MLSIIAVCLFAILLFGLLAAALIVRRRRRTAIAEMREGWGDAGDFALEDIPSLDELAAADEPDEDEDISLTAYAPGHSRQKYQQLGFWDLMD